MLTYWWRDHSERQMAQNGEFEHNPQYISDAVMKQISSGVLVCPNTKKKLFLKAPRILATGDDGAEYVVTHGGVPVLVADRSIVDDYSQSSERMNREYTEG